MSFNVAAAVGGTSVTAHKPSSLPLFTEESPEKDPLNESSSSSVGADAPSVHSHRSFRHDEHEDQDDGSEADADGDQTNDDDTHTQYYETNGSYTHGSVTTTHFGASLPVELMELSGHGGLGHSSSPPSHMHIHHVFMGTTAPSAPATAPILLDCATSDLATTPSSNAPMLPASVENSRSVSAASAASKSAVPAASVAGGPLSALRSPSEEARALEARQTQRRAKIGVRFKTKHCHTYQESGECRYGDSCVFAHGEEELAKYIAIADAAELASGQVEEAKAAPVAAPQAAAATSTSKKHAKTDAAASASKKPGVPSANPIVASASTAAVTANKYRDALMKSVPTATTTTSSAKPIVTVAATAPSKKSPISPTSATAPSFNSKLTALQLHHHMTKHIPVAAEQKRCNDYGFGANVGDERQRAAQGNRRVPQEELERYRLERKADAIARARMSDAGSSSPPTEGTSPTHPNDFFMRQISGGFHQRDNSISRASNSMSEHHFETSEFPLADMDKLPDMAAGIPTAATAAASQLDDLFPNMGGYGAPRSSASSASGNYYANPNAEALHGSGSWDYVHRSQQPPRSPGAASRDSRATSGRYSHNPYKTG